MEGLVKGINFFFFCLIFTNDLAATLYVVGSIREMSEWFKMVL